MADTFYPPLYDRIAHKMPARRALDVTILLLLGSLVVYRLLSLNTHGFAWFLAFLCESWFTFIWVLTISTKWTPVDYKTYPERLLERVEELPPVDMFVTTADPVLEPPIITANTVISLLAVDYPAHKLACYVSDDGCSPLTFYSLVEASKFAQLWVPFCKKYDISVRAPFRYFSKECILSCGDGSFEFHQESRKMKDKYDELCRKIKHAARKSDKWDSSGDLAVFAKAERRNHPSIIKIIWENKEGLADGLPHLIYISREKHPKHPHHSKAGAMNMLTRVSGLITNAPIMLNVDCDMYANNSQIIHHAMCLLLGSKNESDCGFVQSPQVFYDGLKDDPFGNQFEVAQKCMGQGTAGIQGSFYGGTGCFHRRKVIYGLCPDDSGSQANRLTPINGSLADKEMQQIFGNSMNFVKSVFGALQGKSNNTRHLSDLVEAAHKVANCSYEYGTNWGRAVGWQYGSTTEDLLTGLMIHRRGWRSAYCTPDPPAFLGCTPTGGPASMLQQKRWATGMLEILISEKNPIFATLTGKLRLRMCTAYLLVFVWGLCPIPELCYAVLPAYCIISNSYFVPKIGETGNYIYVALGVIYNLYTLSEYLQHGQSIRAWWNNQRMGRISSLNAWLFGSLSVTLKILGISETVFEVTQKEESSDSIDGGDAGRFTFDGSPIFVPGTTLTLVHLAALFTFLVKKQPLANDGRGSGFGELGLSVLVLICFRPFVKGLFGKGKYGIPLSTICKSAFLATVFVHLCKRCSVVPQN
uniref:Cellulose synthase-like protein n=1 Tax=Rhizophora mucronata TaxID=61149 RepID=A0A2P2JHA2_RHIMU